MCPSVLMCSHRQVLKYTPSACLDKWPERSGLKLGFSDSSKFCARWWWQWKSQLPAPRFPSQRLSTNMQSPSALMKILPADPTCSSRVSILSADHQPSATLGPDVHPHSLVTLGRMSWGDPDLQAGLSHVCRVLGFGGEQAPGGHILDPWGSPQPDGVLQVGRTSSRGLREALLMNYINGKVRFHKDK